MKRELIGLIGAALLCIAWNEGALAQPPGESMPDTHSQQTQGYQPSTEKMGPPPPTQELKPLVVPEQERAEPKGYQYACDKPMSREEADSCQQRRSADAAEQTASLTWWQVYTAIAGTFLS